MVISSLPSNYANAVAPFAPLGRQPVSEEDAELKNTSFKPLEESAASARGENRRSPEEKPGEVDERERTRQAVSQEVEKRAEERREQEELELVQELAARDREVRAHERAHAAVGGQYAGAPRYEYTRGPDGVNYATSGEVSIDTGKVPGNPEATLEKAQLIRRAALAPAEPSPQDRRVAAEALRLEAEAKAELLAQRREELQTEGTEEEEAPQSSGERVEAEARAERDEAERERRARRERAEEFAEIGARNIDINRRLIEIGLIEPPVASGQLLSRRV